MSPRYAPRPDKAAIGRCVGAHMMRKALRIGGCLVCAVLAQAAQAADASRGVRVRPVAAQSGGLTIVPVDEPPGAGGEGQGGFSTTVKLETARPPQSSDTSADKSLRKIVAGPIRIAALDGETGWFQALERVRPVVLVDASAKPDLTWDPKSREVLAGLDVVARGVTAADLPGVVDQALTAAWLKRENARADQPIKMLSADQLHTRGSRIDVRVEQLTGRYLILFDLSGIGSAQLLYPLGADPEQRSDPTYTVTFQAREPFGVDYLVAVTAARPMTELQRILRESARRIDLQAFASAMDGLDARIGYIRIFTSP